jgi:monoamine oxidase
MKRRTALRTLGLGLTAGVALPSWLSSCTPEEPGPEIEFDGTIAVIGAGAAGLYVADILKSKGVNVVVYEASSRVGGRIRSIRQFEENPFSNSYPVELGAERIIGSDSVWAKMVSQLERPVNDYTTITSDRFFIDGEYKKLEDLAADNDFIAAQNFLANLKTYTGSNVSVQQAVQAAGLSTRVHAILNSQIGNRYGSSNDNVGITAIAESLNLITRNSNELRLATNPMQDVLSSRFSSVIPQVLFGHAVKKINYSGEKIIIEGERTDNSSTAAFSVEVDRVVVTVPVSVLKEGDITFTPALPSTKTAALSQLGMDAAVRVVLEFKQNFWGLDARVINGGTEIPEYFNVGAGDDSILFAKMLSITIMGPKAQALSDAPEIIVPTILAEMDAHFDGAASENVRRDIDNPDIILSVIQDWTKEPYIRGGISYVKPGGSYEARVSLGEPIQNKLFFAGEATDVVGDAGTINGALVSAERVVQEFVESLNL